MVHSCRPFAFHILVDHLSVINLSLSLFVHDIPKFILFFVSFSDTITTGWCFTHRVAFLFVYTGLLFLDQFLSAANLF